ncbi:hypothetical protein L484_007539 [Morus notabilis]|uniref:Uncharacterized protein n=1 Tax=Morus notabilis TaxID=981085 RepID=W9SZ65_9ROSA|nr:hypothetical protein L484_007539 [Morus notabilis]
MRTLVSRCGVCQWQSDAQVSVLLVMGNAQTKCSACSDHVLDLVCVFGLFGLAIYSAWSTLVRLVWAILPHSACLGCSSPVWPVLSCSVSSGMFFPLFVWGPILLVMK